MFTIHKYSIPIEDKFTLQLPKGARPLCAQTQRDAPCLWALVDPTQPLEPYQFRLVGTGHPIQPEEVEGTFEYYGTIQMHGGNSIFHLFRT